MAGRFYYLGEVKPENICVRSDEPGAEWQAEAMAVIWVCYYDDIGSMSHMQVDSSLGAMCISDTAHEAVTDAINEAQSKAQTRIDLLNQAYREEE